MLFDASVTLSGRCRRLTSVARTEASLQRLDATIARRDHAHHMLALDWSEPDVFIAAIAGYLQRAGAPDLVLAWLHHDELGPRLAQAIAPSDERCAFFQVRGSAAANPSCRMDALLQGRNLPSSIDYHQIILGFHADDQGSRWLHDNEICAGVLDAIEHPDNVTIVGTITPWTNHP